MSGLHCHLITASLVISLMCIMEVCTEVCFKDSSDAVNSELCFSNRLGCWAEDPKLYPRKPSEQDNHFFLYTRNNADSVELKWDDASSLGAFDAQRRTVVVAHGFRSSPDRKGFKGIREAVLRESDVNVIMVDWRKAAAGLLKYPQCRVNSRLVGRQLGILLKLLHDHRNLDYAHVHIVGHSLGAHLSGLAGKYLGGQVGRITGLDPAKPDFKDYTHIPDCILDKTDAQFVDIIHSDRGHSVYGLQTAIGHQDFYPNYHKFNQIGCNYFNTLTGCAHTRAVDFFIASVEHLRDPSTECDYSTKPCDGSNCPSSGCPKMGIEASPTGEEPKSYCLKTKCYKW
ncbi:pancreatic lipase-related protein 2-like [Acanthaster planci]|uniref:Pancreatic lipase-related protein 2-like n=1 Tax=Acanthaster planci TaxID=133434 RepID=A0A8B7ZKI5_ACAPL|nr:pancreatic lipase-related protein 2-like [Acanthaster planci]